MRKAYIIFALFFITTTSFAQEVDEIVEEEVIGIQTTSSIKSDFQKYLDALSSGDLETALTYTNPKLFDIISADQMIQVLGQLYSNPAFDFEMLESEIMSVSETMLIEDLYYATIRYGNTISMKFKFPDMKEAQIKQTNKSILPQLEQTFGKGNVSLNEKTQTFSIYAEKNVCATSEDGESEWKFLTLDKAQKELLEQLLPTTYLATTSLD